MVATGFMLAGDHVWGFLENLRLWCRIVPMYWAFIIWCAGLGVGTAGQRDQRVKNRLKVLRAERDWSQGDLAERLEVSRQSVNAIETGKYDPSLPLAFRIAELFGLPSKRFSRRTDPDAQISARRLAAPAPAARRRRAQPTRFSVTVEGAGPDLILIPGLTSSRRVWDQAVAGLGGRYRVHRIQIAGFGGEPARGNAQGPVLGPVVEELHAYIEANRLRPADDRRPFGRRAASTLMLAERHPEEVGARADRRRAALLSACCSAPTPPPPASSRASPRCAMASRR